MWFTDGFPAPCSVALAKAGYETPNLEDQTMSVAELLWQLTGSRALRNVALQIESTTQTGVATIRKWHARGRQRRALEKLDEALLRDIGRTRAEVSCECAKPFWRP
ncbi:MAG: DUF1127 domain-containing protein [Pseudomonadota bacterium]